MAKKLKTQKKKLEVTKFRLIEAWSSNGTAIAKGLIFDNLPTKGVFSRIPKELFEPFSVPKLVKKKVSKKAKIEPKIEKDPVQNARINTEFLEKKNKQ